MYSKFVRLFNRPTDQIWTSNLIGRFASVHQLDQSDCDLDYLEDSIQNLNDDEDAQNIGQGKSSSSKLKNHECSRLQSCYGTFGACLETQTNTPPAATDANMVDLFEGPRGETP